MKSFELCFREYFKRAIQIICTWFVQFEPNRNEKFDPIVILQNWYLTVETIELTISFFLFFLLRLDSLTTDAHALSTSRKSSIVLNSMTSTVTKARAGVNTSSSTLLCLIIGGLIKGGWNKKTIDPLGALIWFKVLLDVCAFRIVSTC